MSLYIAHRKLDDAYKAYVGQGSNIPILEYHDRVYLAEKKLRKKGLKLLAMAQRIGDGSLSDGERPARNSWESPGLTATYASDFNHSRFHYYLRKALVKPQSVRQYPLFQFSVLSWVL